MEVTIVRESQDLRTLDHYQQALARLIALGMRGEGRFLIVETWNCLE
jgi:hypothetical protein